MEITEKDLEDLLFKEITETPERLPDMGLRIDLVHSPNPDYKIHWLRQVTLGCYGRVDIIGWSRYRTGLAVEVIELKNKPITCADFDQVFRYATAVKEILRNSFRGRVNSHVMTYLIGPSVESGHFIQNNSYPLSVYTFDFTLHGFEFDHKDGWHRGEGNLTLADVMPPLQKLGNKVVKLTDLLKQN